MQCSAIHPAFVEHRLELLAEGCVDGIFGWQQVAVGDGFLALHRWAQGSPCLLEDIGAHVLHDGTHDDDTGYCRKEEDVTGYFP